MYEVSARGDSEEDTISVPIPNIEGFSVECS